MTFARAFFILFLGFSPAIGNALGFELAPGEEVVGRLEAVEARFEDTFSDIARLYDVGYREMLAANPRIDPWLPGEGVELMVPSSFVLPPGPREGIVINLAELRLYYYPKGENRVLTYPLGIGREGWHTPTGGARIVRKKEHPTWTPPESIREEHASEGDPLPEKVEPGPDNPLGDYALYLSMPGYMLHGTNKPYGVGMRVSHGCIRLYPEDISELFAQVPVGTRVRIVNEPYKVGWSHGGLYVEAHPPLAEQFEAEGFNLTALTQSVVQALGDRQIEVDWEKVKAVALEHTGIPIQVLREPPAP